MSNLGKRLTALEEIAEQCRLREMRAALGDEIVRRSREHGLTIAPGDLDAKIDRALAIMETGVALMATGSTLEDVARHLAIQHDLDPDKLVGIWRELRSKAGRAP